MNERQVSGTAKWPRPSTSGSRCSGGSRPWSVVQCRPGERPVKANDGSSSPQLPSKILSLLSKADLKRIATLSYDPADANEKATLIADGDLIGAVPLAGCSKTDHRGMVDGLQYRVSAQQAWRVDTRRVYDPPPSGAYGHRS